MNLTDSLKGYKTYLLGLAGIAYGLGGFFTGHMDLPTLVSILWASLTAMALRAGITNSLLTTVEKYFISPLERPLPPTPATPAPVSLTISQDQLIQLQAGSPIEIKLA
jgi:hypothetical protein